MSPMDNTAFLDELATGLVAPLWRGIPADYKAKYARTIWEQFENQIRSAAYTSRLPHFIQRITTRLGIIIRSDDVESVTAILNSGRDREALKALRDEATYLVLLVRVQNEERKANKK